jgi:hypothetical protein
VEPVRNPFPSSAKYADSVLYTGAGQVWPQHDRYKPSDFKNHFREGHAMFAKIRGQFNTVDPTPKSAGPQQGRRALFVLVALLVLIGPALIVIPAGYVGVYDLFGKVAEQSMAPGIHLVNPLATIHKLSVRTQEVKETVDIPTREGSSIANTSAATS